MIGLERYQRDIIRAAEEFAKGEFDAQDALRFDREQIFPKDLFKKGGELGFLGIHVPEEYGGGGMTYFETSLVSETFAIYDSTYAISMIYPTLGPEAIFLFGTEDQKREILPGAFVGEEVISSAPGSFYSPFDEDIKLIFKDSKRIVVEGELCHVPFAKDSDWLIFGLNRMEFDKKCGAVIFLIPMDRDNMEILPENKGLGWNMTPSYKIRLNGVELEEKDYLGKGFFSISEINRFIISEMVLFASLGVGISQGSLNRAMEYVKVREQFNKKLIEFPVIRDKIGEMVVKVNGARALTREAAKMVSLISTKFNPKRYKNIMYLALSAKMFSARTAKDVSDEAIQLLGGYGYMREYHVERFYRDSKCLELFGGDVYRMRRMIVEGSL